MSILHSLFGGSSGWPHVELPRSSTYCHKHEPRAHPGTNGQRRTLRTPQPGEPSRSPVGPRGRPT